MQCSELSLLIPMACCWVIQVEVGSREAGLAQSMTCVGLGEQLLVLVMPVVAVK